MTGFTPKQVEYLQNATHRWNIKCGATRSGKTYLDYYVIPKRIRSLIGKDGLVVIMGNTRETIRRNIIIPLQSIWGSDLVSDIRTTDNTCRMFGETVYCIGADKVTQVDRIRGSSIKYCYGDEIVTWAEEVFEMLKSRLDKSYSCFDGTCNPEGPEHWFKRFLDSDADIYQQHYTIYDNTFNPPDFIKELEREYAGTVYFNRFILGQWARAEGLIYKRFADNPKRFAISKDDLKDYQIIDYRIGIDFGGNKSNHAFCLSGITADNKLIALKSQSIKATGTDANDLIDEIDMFFRECQLEYRIDAIYADSAEQTLINTIRNNFSCLIYDSLKNPIIDRVRALILMIGGGRFYYVDGDNDALVKGLSQAVYDKKSTEDKRLDDGTSDIDVLDAFEYSWESDIYFLTEAQSIV